MGIENGSTRQGEIQTASCFSSGASRTSFFFAAALERAISQASAAAAASPRRLRSSVAANPQHPSTSTRIPAPSDSPLDRPPTFPFLVATCRVRLSTTRTSA